MAISTKSRRLRCIHYLSRFFVYLCREYPIKIQKSHLSTISGHIFQPSPRPVADSEFSCIFPPVKVILPATEEFPPKKNRLRQNRSRFVLLFRNSALPAHLSFNGRATFCPQVYGAFSSLRPRSEVPSAQHNNRLIFPALLPGNLPSPPRLPGHWGWCSGATLLSI